MSSVSKFAKIVETTEVLSSSFKYTSEAAHVCLSLRNINIYKEHTRTHSHINSQQSLFRIKFNVLHSEYKKVEKFFVEVIVSLSLLFSFFY